jgi:hypothetical protein
MAINWIHSLEQGRALSKEQNRPILLDISAAPR